MKQTLLLALQEAGKIIKDSFEGSFRIEHKEGRNNLVTEVDQAAERKIAQIIKAAHPDHAMLGEEYGRQEQEGESGYLWIVDPIDGTVNFAHGLPLCCVSIGLMKDGALYMGGVYNPMMNELFFAEKGKGAFLNDRPIGVSKQTDLYASLLVTGFPYQLPEGGALFRFFEHMIRQGVPVRRLGSAALDLCWVACGRFEGFWERQLNPWDIAAGLLILQEAGGRVTDFRSNPGTAWDKETLATNGHIHAALAQSLQEHYIDAPKTITMPAIKIINKGPHPLPAYQTAGSAGMDLYAHLSETITLQPMERRLVPTGLSIELPQGMEAQIRPRSGLSIKKGLTVINAPGTIDSDYRGEIQVPIVNLSAEAQTIENGERVAQMIVARHEVVSWTPVESLGDTERGAGGFGHTGK